MRPTMHSIKSSLFVSTTQESGAVTSSMFDDLAVTVTDVLEVSTSDGKLLDSTTASSVLQVRHITPSLAYAASSFLVEVIVVLTGTK